jgi:tRNA(adenine34) deaminase
MVRRERLTAEDNKFMLEALKEAELAKAKGEVPVGAIIVRNGQVIGRGHNLREKMRSPLAHAELLAIDEASLTLNSWRLEDCTIYVTLEPCPMCAGAIIQSRIERLVYGASDPKGGCAGTIINLVEDERFNHQVSENISGIMGKEAAEQLSSFFQELRERNSERK